ncbi:hypothetical protein [Cohnella hashimotonis]|uniref:Uncharacterized protein n=1 Tax=Cohnella hashimotonis TaxID=2826895 RepID=A0ABT6TI81_9BACL|nr:hypothetical protein [Cohnella hashimotonis]MDI4645669.1 hypothetical protein [Cohnella hashimotonis]
MCPIWQRSRDRMPEGASAIGRTLVVRMRRHEPVRDSRIPKNVSKRSKYDRRRRANARSSNAKN